LARSLIIEQWYEEHVRGKSMAEMNEPEHEPSQEVMEEVKRLGFKTIGEYAIANG
jgi:hypothetical protein